MTDFISTKPQMTSALDFAGLAEMRAGAVQGKEQVTKEVAQQFEAIFINMMLKSMRDATERSGLLDSQATKTYESMFDQSVLSPAPVTSAAFPSSSATALLTPIVVMVNLD